MRIFQMLYSNSSVQSSVKNGIGEIILNRPKALNALDLSMVKFINPLLQKWDKDSSVKMVFIRGEGDKAFCAGGDVKVITELARQKEYALGQDFFRFEYMMNYKIGAFKKPYMALLNGITMGGGVGISVHGKYRIATEKTDFAMPETAIGLFPDVGGSFFLPKLPHNLGLYLGLTGQRLKGFDIYKAGIATHFIPEENIAAFQRDLFSFGDITTVNLDKLLTTYQKLDADSPENFLTPDRLRFISKVFGTFPNDTFDDLMIRLNDAVQLSNDVQIAKIPLTLSRMSPTSLKLTFHLLQLSRDQKWNLAQALVHEYRLACRLLRHSDFPEGVRAALVDKDRKPKWNPPKLELVKDKDIERLFEPFNAASECPELSL